MLFFGVGFFFFRTPSPHRTQPVTVAGLILILFTHGAPYRLREDDFDDGTFEIEICFVSAQRGGWCVGLVASQLREFASKSVDGRRRGNDGTHFK